MGDHNKYPAARTKFQPKHPIRKWWISNAGTGTVEPWVPNAAAKQIHLPLLTSRHSDRHNYSSATLSRASATSIIDWEGNVIETLVNEFGMDGYVRVENLMPDPTNPITRTVSNLKIGRYTFAVRGGTGNVVLSGDAVDTVNPQEGFVFTLAATGSVTFTVNGDIDNYQLELNTNASSDAPSQFVEPNDSVCSQNLIAVRYFNTAPANSWV